MSLYYGDNWSDQIHEALDGLECSIKSHCEKQNFWNRYVEFRNKVDNGIESASLSHSNYVPKLSVSSLPPTSANCLDIRGRFADLVRTASGMLCLQNINDNVNLEGGSALLNQAISNYTTDPPTILHNTLINDTSKQIIHDVNVISTTNVDNGSGIKSGIVIANTTVGSAGVISNTVVIPDNQKSHNGNTLKIPQKVIDLTNTPDSVEQKRNHHHSRSVSNPFMESVTIQQSSHASHILVDVTTPTFSSSNILNESGPTVCSDLSSFGCAVVVRPEGATVRDGVDIDESEIIGR